MIRLMFLLCILFVQQSVASSPTDNASHQISEEEITPIAPLVSRQDWISNFQSNMPTIVCEPEKDFLRCFDITAEECKVVSQWFASACLDNMTYQIPEQVDEQAGKQMGIVAGHCINTLYFKFMSNKRKEGENCPLMPQESATKKPTDNSEVVQPKNHSTPPQTSSEPLPDPTKPADYE